MADGSRELREMQKRLQSLAAARYAPAIVEAGAEEWVEVSQDEVLKDTHQTEQRTVIAFVGGTASKAWAEVVSDTPYAGWIQERWGVRYFDNGGKAAKALIESAGGALGTDIRRVLVSGGSPNPRSLFN